MYSYYLSFLLSDLHAFVFLIFEPKRTSGDLNENIPDPFVKYIELYTILWAQITRYIHSVYSCY